jgi:hypothetical protein
VSVPATANLVKAQRLEAMLAIKSDATCIVLRDSKPDDIMPMRARMV